MTDAERKRRWQEAHRPPRPNHPDLPGEEWRDVVGYEGVYLVSNRGRVKRIGVASRAVVGHILKPWIGNRGKSDPLGYHYVQLNRDNVGRGYSVHRLVASAFIRPPTAGEEVNHKDGLRGNNDIANLEWVTSPANRAHAVKHGLMRRGESATRARLTESQVREIRALRPSYTLKDLGTRFGVSLSTISLVCKRRIWKHV